MRTSAICTLIFMISAILTSCKKENANIAEPSSSLIGSSWTVANDSTSERIGAITNDSNYIGKTTDYFNFTTYGKLYWSINGQRDTATYLISGDTIKFKYGYVDFQTKLVDSAYDAGYIISNLTNHTCTLFNSEIVFGTTDSGPILTTINLKK
jgi:hypothetical protein